jgi:hypothetical protein
MNNSGGAGGARGALPGNAVTDGRGGGGGSVGRIIVHLPMTAALPSPTIASPAVEEQRTLVLVPSL